MNREPTRTERNWKNRATFIYQMHNSLSDLNRFRVSENEIYLRDEQNKITIEQSSDKSSFRMKARLFGTKLFVSGFAATYRGYGVLDVQNLNEHKETKITDDRNAEILRNIMRLVRGKEFLELKNLLLSILESDEDYQVFDRNGKAIPAKRDHLVKKEVDNINDEFGDCCICLEKLPKRVKVTKCNHKYCRECIDEWTKKNYTCPLCRTKL